MLVFAYDCPLKSLPSKQVARFCRVKAKSLEGIQCLGAEVFLLKAEASDPKPPSLRMPKVLINYQIEEKKISENVKRRF